MNPKFEGERNKLKMKGILRATPQIFKKIIPCREKCRSEAIGTGRYCHGFKPVQAYGTLKVSLLKIQALILYT
jgi:hypothetical protein